MWDDGVGNVHHWLSGSAPRRRGTCLPARDYLITVTLRSQRNSEGEAAQDITENRNKRENFSELEGLVPDRP